MKRFLTPALAAAVLFSACDARQALRVEVTDRVISSDYVGNGVEWDPYDEAEAWGAEVSDADWAKLSERLDFMRPGYVRCMINSPYRYYDAATGRYDRMRNLASLRRLLQYCQDNGITVAYGEYNPPTWAMKDSQQWVEMSVDYLNFLVCDLGFDCIRHFIIFNEPDGNWASTDGDYDLWRSMAQRFDAEMARYPDLKRKVSLAAPDVVMSYKNPASEYDAAGWVARSAQDLGAQIGIYDVHAYPGQHEVRSGAYAEKLRRIRAEVPAGKKLILGEAGYKYSAPEDSLLKAEYDRRVAGHPFTEGSDCNMLCYDYFYGLDMPLLAIEVMNNGLSGGGGVDARRRHAFERRFGPHGGREDLGNVEHPRRGGLRRRFAGGTAALVLHLVADVPSFSRRVRHPRLRGSAARGAARGGSPQGCGIQRRCGQLLAGAVYP